MLEFEIDDIDALGRIGTLRADGKLLKTPALLPVVHPYDNLIKISELKKIGFNCIFTNAYILYQNQVERDKALTKGLHKYLDYNGLIATDSGAFQLYMYSNDKFNINPIQIEKFQEDIGSNFPVILDIPVQPDDHYEKAKEKVYRSISRARENIDRRRKEINWIGPIHGAIFPKLLEKSTLEMSKLDFSVYAIGGLVKFFLNYRFESILKILSTVKKKIIHDKPLHMFGLGLPQFFSLAVAFGCDLMDSAAYILYAKEKRYFTLSMGTVNLDELYEFPCNCPVCSNHTPKEVKNLEEAKQIQLLAKHNLYLSYSEIKTIRQAIYNGNLWELVEERIRAHPSLTKSLSILSNEAKFFEKFEKLYKNHGRLFTSYESQFRPIITRYFSRVKSRYRVPIDTKYALILPELDVKEKNSPTIKNWLNFIKHNDLVSRNEIHILYYSNIFGLIPEELANSYPMGQYESIDLNKLYDGFYKKSWTFLIDFINHNSSNYKKCGLVLPDNYVNQFDEEKRFNKYDKTKIVNYLKSNLSILFSQSNNINEILKFFSE